MADLAQQTLLAAVRSGDQLALARAITAIENQTAIGAELSHEVSGARRLCRTLGVTGPPGAGKSSLINALVAVLLPRHPRIGVITVDPSSPVSGGAVLGDRVRMAAYSANPNVFIRSLAARGHLGGVTKMTRAIIDVLAASGSDLVIVETVGTGQSEVEVARLTDVKIAVCAPGLGDEMQAIKAGVLEVADMLVVNKSDLPDAERTFAHLRSMLHHRGHDERRSAHKVSSRTSEGLGPLAAALETRFADIAGGGLEWIEGGNHPRTQLAEDVADLASQLVCQSSDPRLNNIIKQLAGGILQRRAGAIAALRVVAAPESSADSADHLFVGTVAPEGADKLDEGRLTGWLEADVEGFVGPIALTKFKGGQSNPTYRIESPSGRYVLRRKPFGPLLPSAHAVDREFKVQAGLYKTGFPVARQYGLCTDESVIGSWFYVMGMVEGRTIWNGAMANADPAERRATYFAMIDTLARLHNTDVEAAGLSDYGRPGNYFGRQVERWTKQYKLAETETMPEMERLIAWLPATLPEQTRTSVVHGDYRIDNMIYAHDRPEVLAVLDWELSTLGDPLADFTYVAMAWVTGNGGRSGVMDLDRQALGIPELDEVVERYCAATGRDGLPDMNWYFAYNYFRLAGIMQGIKKRVIDGTASSAHARAMSERVLPLAQKAWEFAEKAQA